jgi:hypothetical protein
MARAKAVHHGMLALTFADGLFGEFECSSGCATCLADTRTPSGFKRVSVAAERGMVTSPGGDDLAPDTLYVRVRAGVWPDDRVAARSDWQANQTMRRRGLGDAQRPPQQPRSKIGNEVHHPPDTAGQEMPGVAGENADPSAANPAADVSELRPHHRRVAAAAPTWPAPRLRSLEAEDTTH